MVLAAKHRISTSQRSPTLSDAGMILPGFEADHARSTSPVFERPPSVSALYNAYSSPKLDFPPQNRRRASQQKQSPPLSAQSSRSTLRNMGDSGAPAKRTPARDDVLASSPTIDANGLTSFPTASWEDQEQRRLSTASSLLSEEFENWPGFDSHGGFDDSGVDLEEQEKRDRVPSGLAKDGDDMENERWLNGRTSGSDEDEDDPQSSAALSRRAEMILANAKKRLNVCVIVCAQPIGQPLIVTGHGGQSQRSSRVAGRITYVQPCEKHVRAITAHCVHTREGSETLRWHWANPPSDAFLSSKLTTLLEQ
jgi:hypothetical protein